MIRSVAASVPFLARPSAPSVPRGFTADIDVLTQYWEPSYAKCVDFGSPFNVITRALDGQERDDDQWPKDLTVHGDKTSNPAIYSCPKTCRSSWCQNGTRPPPCTLEPTSFDSRFEHGFVSPN